MIYIMKQVWATTFKPQRVSYPPSEAYRQNPSGLWASLPYAFKKAERLNRWPYVVAFFQGDIVRVRVVDVGPWNTTDAYWRELARPRVELQKLQGLPADNGRIPTQIGAVDFSPAVWIALGVDPAEANSYNFSGMLEYLAIVEGAEGGTPNGQATIGTVPV